MIMFICDWESVKKEVLCIYAKMIWIPKWYDVKDTMSNNNKEYFIICNILFSWCII